MITRRRALTTLFVALGAGACRRRALSSPEAVLYSSVDEGYALALADLAKPALGAGVRVLSDTEVAKSSGLVTRLIAERARPQADVFLSGDPLRAAHLKRHGLLAPWRPVDRAPLAGYDDPDGAWAASSARLRLILQHRSRKEESPRSVLDLAEARWAPLSCIAHPLFGTATMHAAWLFHQLGAAGARQFFENFSRRGGRMLASNGEVRRRVAAGEFVFGLTDSDDVSVALRDRASVDFIVPDQEAGAAGVLVVPTVVCVIAGAPHPALAEQLAAILCSSMAERWLAGSEAAHLPLRTEVKGPALFPFTLAELRRADASAADLVLALESANDFLADWAQAQAR